MSPEYEKITVLIIVLATSILTWKMVKDFYITKFHAIFAHLIAVISASFMLLSTMFLFMPKNYQRGVTSEVELSFSSIVIIIVMLGALYLFFRFVPDKKKDN